MKKCYIICGGPESFDSAKIDKDSYIICADSGYDKALSSGISPDLVIGDFDSIEAVPSGVKVIKAPTNKTLEVGKPCYVVFETYEPLLDIYLPMSGAYLKEVFVS